MILERSHLLGARRPAYFRNGVNVKNKLNHAQYDLTTWSARSWLSFQTQQLSVKLHITCAWEIATELGFAAVTAVADPRGP